MIDVDEINDFICNVCNRKFEQLNGYQIVKHYEIEHPDIYELASHSVEEE